MNTDTIPTNDIEYNAAVKELLAYIKNKFHPFNIPLDAGSQAIFISSVFGKVHNITHSEPHLRGELIKSMYAVQKLDFENLEKELDYLKETISILTDDRDILYDLMERVGNLKKKDSRGAAAIIKELKDLNGEFEKEQAGNE